MTIDIKNFDRRDIRFDGRTIICMMTIANDVDHNKLGTALRHFASGPLKRMTVVLQKEIGDACNITILVNTDEDVEVVRKRILMTIKSGDPNDLVCREATPEDRAKEIWDEVIKFAEKQHEQQTKSQAYGRAPR